MRHIRRFLICFTLLVVAAAFYGWAAGSAGAAPLPGGTPILDNFNRANENPLSGGGNWSSVFSGGAQLLNNAVASSNTGTSTSAWRNSYTGDVEARATVLIPGNNAGVMTDATVNGSGQLSGYLWQWQGGNSPATFALYREDTDNFTQLATFNGFLLTAGDQIALQVIGSSVQGWVYHLGSWQQVASATDTTYRTGKLGLRVRGTTPIADDFGGGPVQSAPRTVVSLTFDDNWADQSVVGPMLAAHGMHGTFYVNSANVGSSGFGTWPQLQALQSAGNEIGGHTLNHIDLTTADTTEAQRQVCQDRRALLSEGLNVSDFAYPYGAYNATVITIVQNCGYNSARGAWGLCSPAQSGCPSAETIPPLGAFGTRTEDAVRAWTTLQDFQNQVINGEATGGWVTFQFHHVCDGCDPNSYSVTQSVLQAFLDWLQPRSANGTVVETVHDVMGGSVQPPPSVADQTAPTSSIACNGSPCSGAWFAPPATVSLSAVDSGTGVAVIRYTTDGSGPTASSPIYSGPFPVSTTTTVKYRAWDMAGNIENTNTQLIQIDPIPPTSTIACNGSTCSSGSYGAGVTASLSATDTGGSGVAAIRYTTDGSDPTSSSTLYLAPFTVPTTTTVKYRAWDNAGNVEATNSQLIQVDTTPPDNTPPSSSIACNGSACSSGWYTASVSVSLSATDSGSGVAAIRYTTDGSDPTTASPLYSNPFTVSTTTTVKYRAWDVAGNVEATNTQLIQIDAAAPSSSIACNGSACSANTYSASVSVSLSATDSGSGVAAIRYTTDGSDPNSSSPLYTSPFTVSTTTTVKYRAWDVAGNVEPTNTQLIQIDTVAPSSSIACNGSACSSGWYTAGVTVSLSSTDSGSGVAAIRYTTDGSNPTTSSPLYLAPFTVPATATVKYRAWDVAGNVEATKSQLIRIDSTPPVSSIACNGAACTSGWYRAPVSVSLSATDAGSGVAAIRYTLDGSNPTGTSTLYTGPFNLSATTTVKFRAWDAAGNVEATRTQVVQIDSTAPTVAITSPANGATVTGNIKIVASASDSQSGVASVAFYVDGSLIGTATNSPWQVQWNTRRVPTGQHVLTAIATDRVGNSQASAAITVTVR
jgi:peptidoglycan/xylan/chitin deacetylase (PgdA/CDA1 family)/N-acetyl-beta-hexosaminidase